MSFALVPAAATCACLGRARRRGSRVGTAVARRRFAIACASDVMGGCGTSVRRAMMAAAIALSTLPSASPLAEGGARCDVDDAVLPRSCQCHCQCSVRCIRWLHATEGGAKCIDVDGIATLLSWRGRTDAVDVAGVLEDRLRASLLLCTPRSTSRICHPDHLHCWHGWPEWYRFVAVCASHCPRLP